MTTLQLRDFEFEQISRLVYNLCGIHLHEGKKELVKARLGKHLRGGPFKSFADYYRYVTTEDGTDELVAMIDSLSTNLTSFFREDKHFAKLRAIVPALLQSRRANGNRPRIRIWSAGCSTGEEPYSIAIAMEETECTRIADIKILATDISTRVLKTATGGIYSEEKTQKIPADLVRKYFLKGHGNWEGFYRVKNSLKGNIEFMRLNLKEKFSFQQPFDIIFCRNVMIYFDKEMQTVLINKFYDCMREGGYLFIGHSESLTGIAHSFKYIEPSVYRR